MHQLIHAEFKKMRHTMAIWIILLLPLFALLLAVKEFNEEFHRDADSWADWYHAMRGYAELCFLPLVGLICAATSGVEHQNQSLKYLLCLPRARWKVYMAKAIVTATLIGLGYAAFLIEGMAAGLALMPFNSVLPFSSFGYHAAAEAQKFPLAFIASGFQIAFCTWLSLRVRSFMGPLLGVLGTFLVAFYLHDTPLRNWIVGLVPSAILGTMVQSTALWLAIALSTGSGLLITFAAAYNFSRRKE